MIGTIIKQISNNYTVSYGKEKCVCKPRGKFRKNFITPMVGDKVVIDLENKYILDIMPRKNVLYRPNVANVDVCLIVSSLKEPDLSLSLLDKQLVHIIFQKIEPIICFTKLDLASKKELDHLNKLRKYYEKINIKTFTNQEIKKLVKYLQKKVVVLTGQSGAGKSSLLNKIDSQLNLKTDVISKALNRGKHTTRHTEIITTNNIYFCDTPGFSSLNLSLLTKEQLKETFFEFKDCHCRFKDCLHNLEKDCEVKKKVLLNEISNERYQNYLKFLREVLK